MAPACTGRSSSCVETSTTCPPLQRAGCMPRPCSINPWSRAGVAAGEAPSGALARGGFGHVCQVVREHGLGLACTWDLPGISASPSSNGAAPAGGGKPWEEAPFTTWKFRPEGVSQGIIDFIWCATGFAKHTALRRPSANHLLTSRCASMVARQVLAHAHALAAAVAHAKTGRHWRGGPTMRAILVRSPGALCCVRIAARRCVIRGVCGS